MKKIIVSEWVTLDGVFDADSTGVGELRDKQRVRRKQRREVT